MNKLHEILRQYKKEVDIINHTFTTQKDNPPIPKGQPPIGGSILWERSLFERIKRTIVRFLSLEDMMNCDEGQAVKAHYLRVAKQMKAYEDDRYERWRAATESNLPGLLRRTLLTKKEASDTLSVNFAPELSEIILESKYLEQLGFTIPELARNMSLQEHKYGMFRVGLRNMLERYHRIMHSLNDAELDLLQDHIKQLQQTLKSGHTRLNWNTLGIKEYVVKCEKMIDKFESLVNQVHDIARDISGRIDLIAMSDYFVYTDTAVPDIKTYFEVVEANRARDIELLARKYRAMGPLLTKLEGLVVSTNTGRAERMANYYKHWEKRVYEAVVTAIVDNLTNFNNALKRDQPLFRIEAALTGSDIVLRPAITEIQKLVLQSLRDAIEGTRSFVRWMDGTCIETPPQNNPDSDEPYIFTFHSDILPLPSVTEVCLQIMDNLQKMLLNCIRIAARWRKYKPIWKLDKALVSEKFANKAPSCIDYDNKLQFYTKLVKDVALINNEEQQQAFALDLLPLQSTVKRHAHEWIEQMEMQLNLSVKDRTLNMIPF